VLERKKRLERVSTKREMLRDLNAKIEDAVARIRW
jgi:hypothetical protein